MPAPSRRRLVVAALAVALVVGGALAWRALAGPRVAREAGGYSVVRGADMYRYDAVFGVESLWVEGADGTYTQVASPDPARVEPLRAALLRTLRLRSTADIPREREGERNALEEIGYL